MSLVGYCLMISSREDCHACVKERTLVVLSKGCKVRTFLSLRVSGIVLPIKVSFGVANKEINSSYFSVFVRMISIRREESLSHAQIGLS